MPNGPTSPVALLIDETGAHPARGHPAVAWQTPWSEITNIELVRFAHQMALFATVGRRALLLAPQATSPTTRCCARSCSSAAAWCRTERRRAGVFVVVAVVVFASFGGGIAAWFNRGNGGAQRARRREGHQPDLEGPAEGWYKTSQTAAQLPGAAREQVYTSTTTTAPPKNSDFDRAAAVFQSCLGVTNAKDRVYGAAGQEPDYQVSSPIFNTNSLGGIEVGLHGAVLPHGDDGP